MNRRRGGRMLWSVLLAPLWLGACTGTPDLVREDKAPGEAFSPAEQFRYMQSGGESLNSDYFVERGQVQNGYDIFEPLREQEKKSTTLQDRVTRLEQQVQAGTGEGSHRAETISPGPSAAAQAQPSSGLTAEEEKRLNAEMEV